MITFRQFIRQNKATMSLTDIRHAWQDGLKEGIFSNGEHTPLDSFNPCYFRGTPGKAYSYDIVGNNCVEKYVSIKRINWDKVYWEDLGSKDALNVVCY